MLNGDRDGANNEIDWTHADCVHIIIISYRCWRVVTQREATHMSCTGLVAGVAFYFTKQTYKKH